jgi:hypothetical protein
MTRHAQLLSRALVLPQGIFSLSDSLAFLTSPVLSLLAADIGVCAAMCYLQVKKLMLAGVLNPSHGFSVMCSTGAELLIKMDGLYCPYGERKEKYGTGIELFRRSARQVFWMVHWNMNAKSGRQLMDVRSDLFLCSVSAVGGLATLCIAPPPQ